MNITTGKIAKAQKVVLYGPEGIGKSSLAAQFPNPLFIDTEGSTHNMDVQRMDRPSSWTFLIQEVEYVKNNRPCKTLILDTIDWGERLAIEHICQANQKDSIEDFGYGSGYIKLEEEIGRFLNLLSDVVESGINVVLTAHSQIRKFEQPDEMGAYDRYELKLGKKTSARTSALVKEWADMVLFLNYKTYSVSTDDKGKKHKAQGGTRTIYTTHHPAWDAKNRHNLPDEIPMEYAQIGHIFNVTQDDPKPIEHPQSSKSKQEINSVTMQSEDQPKQETKTASSELNPEIPKALRDLMIQNNVTESEIQIVVGQKGYYPQDTPITNYDQSFIDGVLVGAWPQVLSMIQEFNNKVPFK